MLCYSTISVFDILGSTLHTREASKTLLEVVKDDHCDQIDLDFTGIEYISRSFADQFHIDKLELAGNLNKRIIVTNANDAVINMLQAVAKTQNKSDRNKVTVPIYRYSNSKALEHFLLTF